MCKVAQHLFQKKDWKHQCQGVTESCPLAANRSASPAVCNHVQTDQMQHIWSSSQNTDLSKKNDCLVVEVSFLVVWKQSGIAVHQPPQLFFTHLVPTGQTDGSLLAGMTYYKSGSFLSKANMAVNL